MASPGHTMKAIQCTEHGDPLKVLKIVKVPIPEITNKDHVLVKVFYAAINPVDWKIAKGQLGFIAGFIDRKPPFTLCGDFCGRVIDIGSNIKHVKIRDIVYGNSLLGGTGSMAEYLIATGKTIWRKPSNLTSMQAAGVPLATMTSYQALTKAGTKNGDKLLIFGGSTATGMSAIQIAKNVIGCAQVTVTSQSEKLCKSLGADTVINYKKQNWAEVLKDQKFDVIYDCVGGREYWDKARRENVIKSDGYFISIVGDTMHGMTVTLGSLLASTTSMVNRKFWGALNYQKYDMFTWDSGSNIDEVTELIEANKLKPMIDVDSPFVFNDYLELVKKSMSHRAKGKLILQICKDDENTTKNQKSYLRSKM